MENLRIVRNAHEVTVSWEDDYLHVFYVDADKLEAGYTMCPSKGFEGLRINIKVYTFEDYGLLTAIISREFLSLGTVRQVRVSSVATRNIALKYYRKILQYTDNKSVRSAVEEFKSEVLGILKLSP